MSLSPNCIKICLFIILGLLLCGCKSSLPSYFDYVTQNVFVFDKDGKIVPFNPENTLAPNTQSNITIQITGTGEYLISDKQGFSYKGNPGDRVFPIYENQEYLYLLTEKNSDYMQVLEYNKNLKKSKLYPHKNREACGIIAYNKLHAIQYYGDTYKYDFFTAEFEVMHENLKNYYNTDNIFWENISPDGIHWLVLIFFKNRPELVVGCNIETGTWTEISKPLPYQPDDTQIKEIFNFIASDEEIISGILSFPPEHFGKKELPLIVFPHGGPQSRSMLAFDSRVDILTQHGFLVYQPNFRGSTGQGKKFRQQGWKAEGIRRGLADIAEGTLAIIKNNFADSQKVAILGGSWGAYCALAGIALYPELYHAAIAFFGPTDLIDMLNEFLEKSGADPVLDKLQYGDIQKKETIFKLKQLSPYYLINNIKAPVHLYHFEEDKIISYDQSDKFYRKMKKFGKEIVFIKGKGEHGFSKPEDEVNAYKRSINFLNKVFQHE